MKNTKIILMILFIMHMFMGGEAIGSPVPELVVDSTLYNYGEVIRGKKISHAFILKNNGNADLIIEEASPD